MTVLNHLSSLIMQAYIIIIIATNPRCPYHWSEQDSIFGQLILTYYLYTHKELTSYPVLNNNNKST